MSSNGERALQLNYWKEHSIVLSVEAMMLDSQASKLDKEEKPEILSLLPSLEGKSVVELGAGIGRYTAELAKSAYHVLAVDFVESVIKKNEETNGYFKNIQFMCADVTSSDLKIEPGSIDLIFSNWLLMYLSDMEVEVLAKKMVQWVKMGGYIFFRESCFHQSGDHKRKDNPTHYREPSFYIKAFKECQVKDVSGTTSELSLVSCKCVGAYVRNKKNQNQVCWLWQKVKSAGDKGLQKFVNGVQYTCSDILWYERMFGEGFVSIGGLETTKEFVDKLELKVGQKVLDVGCGIGGGDFYMAEKFDVEVVAIDLSLNMISFALERAIGRKCAIEFEVADFSRKEYPPDTFDVIYSRDTLLHIQDKATLFQKFFKWLKPGGKLLISDYCKAQAGLSSEFQDFVKQHGNYLYDLEAYGQMLRNSGFCDVVAEDRTDQFIKIMEKELSVLEKSWNTFICDFSVEDNASIIDGWKGELNRSLQGELRWGLFLAKKD